MGSCFENKCQGAKNGVEKRNWLMSGNIKNPATQNNMRKIELWFYACYDIIVRKETAMTPVAT